MTGMAEPALIIDFANRFEAVATDGFEGRPYAAALAELVRRVKTHGVPDLAPRVAHALGIMAAMIGESDPAGRFIPKIAILQEAAALLRSA
jgi:hypothetical protein